MNYDGTRKQESQISYFFAGMIGFIIGVFILCYTMAQWESPTEKPAINRDDYMIHPVPTDEGGDIMRQTVNQEYRQTNQSAPEPESSETIRPTEENGSSNEIQGKTVDCDKIDGGGVYGADWVEKAKYYCSLNPEARMLAAYNQESGYNPWALGGAGEKGVCQLMSNRTNNVWLNDKRWDDWKWQAQVCVEKWKAVPVKGVIWMSVKSGAYKKYLYLFK